MKTSLSVKTVSLAVVLALAGCGTTSPMLKPSVNAPGAWNEAVPQNGAAVSATWWNTFGSQELQSLVTEALAGSPDLAIAMERVRQAEAQVRIAGASLFPSLDLGVGTSTRTTRDDRRLGPDRCEQHRAQRELRARPVGPQSLRRALPPNLHCRRPRSIATPHGLR